MRPAPRSSARSLAIASSGCDGAACAPAHRTANRRRPSRRIRLEELLQLHRGAHISLDLELAGHVRGGGIEVACHDLLEVLVRGRDRAVGVAASFADADGAVVAGNEPLPRTFDVEAVR